MGSTSVPSTTTLLTRLSASGVKVMVLSAPAAIPVSEAVMVPLPTLEVVMSYVVVVTFLYRYTKPRLVLLPEA